MVLIRGAITGDTGETVLHIGSQSPHELKKLNTWLDIILKEAFVESSYIDAINQNLYREDFTRNAATIESSLLD